MRLLFPGSFDPPHLGHLDIIQRAASVALSGRGELLVALAHNPDKQGWLASELRFELLSQLCALVPGALAMRYSGATVAFARKQGVQALVRGLRNPLDFENEKSMAEVNRSNGLDTLFFVTAGKHAHLSSHLVRTARSAGLPIADLVPSVVAARLP